MNNQSWNEGLFEILSRRPRGKRTLKRAWGNHHPSRQKGSVKEEGESSYPENSWKKTAGLAALDPGSILKGPLEMITTSAPESSLLGMGNSRECSSWAESAKPRGKDMAEQCITQRNVHYQGSDPQWDCRWKSYSSHKKSKGGQKKRAEPQTQEFLIGLPWELQRRLASPVKWNKIPTELIRLLITPNLVV